MTDGLIVKEPFARRLVSGNKKIEFRSKPLPRNKTNVEIFVLNNGNVKGYVVFSGATYDKDNKIYKYSISKSAKFSPELKYKHKLGCIIWINDVELIDNGL